MRPDALEQTCVAAVAGAGGRSVVAVSTGAGDVGYASAAYARALGSIGMAVPLGASGGWCLLRSIAGTPWQDATGPYPFLSCGDWTALPDALDALAGTAVSVVFVTDPLAAIDTDCLTRACPDVCRPYKSQYIVDLAREHRAIRPVHHRRNVRQGLRRNVVEITHAPLDWLPEWIPLYEHLVERHAISGSARFPPESFRAQFAIHGLVAARAVSEGETVGMTLWFVTDDRAYYHLGAASAPGLESRAMFAMFDVVIEHMASLGVRQLCLGAGAGTHSASAGLDRFKRGWANGVAPAHICGRILDGAAYAQACSIRGCSGDERYFPAYRRGE
jgi:hypothetical protein